MCPGGIIAPAATNPDELVVNGLLSPSKRNNPFANSGIVVPVEREKDVFTPTKTMDRYPQCITQQEVEQKHLQRWWGKFVAPAQRLIDFCENKMSSTLPVCS